LENHGEILELVIPRPSVKFSEITVEGEEDKKKKLLEKYKELCKNEGIERAIVKFATIQQA